MEQITKKLEDLVGADNVSVRTRRATPAAAGDENDSNVKTRPREPEQREDATEEERPRNADDTKTSARSGGFTCDRCDATISNIHMSCQDCPNFDYCAGCFTDAKTIHPGHRFKPMQGREPAPAGNYDYTIRSDFAAMKGKALPLFHRGDGESRPDHTCRSCRSLTETFAVWHHLMDVGSDESLRASRLKAIQQKDQERTWTVRVTSLAEATALGCPFCSYFLKKLFGPEGGIAFSYRAQKPWFQVDDPTNEERAKAMKRAMYLSSKLPRDEFVFRVKPVVKTRLERGGPWLEKVVFTAIRASCNQEMIQECFGPRGAVSFELLAFAAKGNPASSNAPIAPEPASAATQSLARARTWLDACINTHGPTCSVRASVLPTRVIDVADEHNYHIFVPQTGQLGAYCALSYQWGGPQEVHLSTENLAGMRDSFRADSLPKTIADAAHVTRSLGLQFLWVDALCILQVSVEDKIHEISHMEDIYRRATVTIIAASSSSAKSGFLTHQDANDPPFWRSLVPLRYPVVNMLGNDNDNSASDQGEKTPKVQWGEFLFMDDMEVMDYGVTKDPATSRSWCLQERLISPRVLNYGRWPLWRCNKLSLSDGGFYISSDPKVNKADEFARLLIRTWEGTERSQADHFITDKLLRAWYGIVNDYTGRQLSDPLDRLTAIDGIAKIISEISRMTNVAGLWRNNLLHDLTWYADTREWLTRPAVERAPTWSWASIDHAISYDHIDHDANPIAQIVNCHVEHVGSGVVSGRVTIQGQTREVGTDAVIELFKSQDIRPAVAKKASLVDFYRQMMEQLEDNRRQATFAEEHVRDTLPQQVKALLMFQHEKRLLDGEVQHGPFYSGLLISRIDDHYQRIGSFRQERTSWLEDLENGEWHEEQVIIE